jgi:hypothetical protein
MKKLLTIAAIIAVVAISKADKLSEVLDIWPNLTAMEKALVLLVCVLLAAIIFAMHRGLSWLNRRLERKK